MADKIDQLYDALYADGAVQNSRENFRNYFLAQGDEGYYNRKNLYDALKADGAVQSPTYEDFMQNFNWKGVKRPVRQPAARPAQTPSFDFAPLDTREANQGMIGRGPVSWDDQQQESPDNPIRRITQGNLTPKEEQRVQKRMQQRMDEIAYEGETGNRMRQPVKDIQFEAPAIERDEFGNVRRDENGNPLVGFTTDEDAVREHRDIVAEQAEWDSLSAEQKRQRAREAKLRAEEIEYTEPTLWDTISKKTKSSIIRKGAELVDFMQQMTSGLYVEDPSSPTGYIRTATYEEQQKNKKDPLTRMSDYLHDEADVLSRQGEPLQGRDFLDLLWDGEIGAAMQKGVGVALESLPMTLSAYNPVTMAMNGILMASGNYRQELLDNPDIPAPKRFAMAVGSAAIEQIVEKYSDPVFKYVGGSKILKGFAKEEAEEIAKDVTKKATETLAQRIFRGLGGLAKDAAGEATEEIFTDFGSDALGELLDLASGDKDYGIRAQWEQMKKENPNASLKDFAWQKAKEYINDGIAGGMAGAYTSGTTQASVKGLQFALGNRASAEDITRNPDARIDPVTMEVAQSYDDGYTETEPDLMKRYNDEAQASAADLPKYGKEFAKMVMESDSPVETLDNLMQNRDLYTDEQIAAAADYFQKMSRVNGAMDGALDRIDREIENANSKVIYNTHQASGQVITAQVGDGAYYIIGGDVVTDEETGMPVAVGTGGAVVVMDPVTGENSVKPASQVIVTSMQSADEMIQYNENVLRQQLMQQADDNFTYGSPANEVYQLQDTVTLNDGEGNTITGEIVDMPNSIDGVYQVQTNDTNEPMKYLTADELNRRIATHNGMEVQRAGGQIGGQIVGQNIPDDGNNRVENISNQPQPAESGTDQATGETPTTEESGESNQPQSALSRIPLDDKGQPDYLQAQPQDSYDSLVDELGEEDANMIIESEVSDAKKRLEKLQKTPPKGATIEEKKKSLSERRKAIEDEQRKIDYWNSVQEIPRSRKAEADRLAAEEAQRKAVEERKALMRTPEGRRQILDEAKNSEERVSAAKEIYGEYFNGNIGEPDTVHELVSLLLPYGKINWEGYDRAGRHVRGLQEELGSGFTRGLSKDRGTSAFNPYLAKKGEGDSLDSIVHGMYEDDANLSGGEHRFTTEGIKDAAIEMLLSAEKPKDIRDYTVNHRIDMAEAMLSAELEAEAEDFADFYHLNPEEREAFEEYIMQLGIENSQLSDADIQEIISIFADEYAKIEEYEQQNRGSQEMDQQPAERGNAGEIEGGEGQVQRQAAGEETAGADNAGQRAEGAEADTGQPPVPGDDVPGGTPVPGVTAPSEQLKPTDLRDATRVESPEIGVAEANEKARGYALSSEVNEFGVPFVLSKDGTTTFGEITEESGLTPAPIKLNEGEDRIDEEGHHHGYGLKHIEAGHGEQIRNAGYNSIEEFVEQVAKNYDTIREGGVVADNQTYLLEISDEHNNTLFVQLSRDGKYWNINSAGIFKKKYSRNKSEVYTRPAVESGTDTDSSGVNRDQTEGATATSGNSPSTSDGKDTNNSSNLQEKSEKSSDLGATSSPEQIAEEENRVDTNPSDAQKEAGNYQKGHIKIDGLDITIENPKGSVRRGTDADGNAWETTMHNTYGYIRGTEATDGDHLDVFLSDDPASGGIFVVDQVDPKTGKFDEVKIMIGFADAAEAMKAYLSNYEKGWKGLGAVTGVSREVFKEWVESSHRKTKPFREYAIAKSKGIVDDHKADGEVQSPDNQETALRDAVVDHLRSIGVEVSTDWQEGQRILDEYNGNGQVKKMGQKTNKKKAQIAADLKGMELTPEQQAVVDVYTGRKNNATVSYSRDGKNYRVSVRKGNEKHAGAEHSLYGHYGTTEGVITSEDILKIPEILSKGKKDPVEGYKYPRFNYTVTGEDGKTYTVVTELKDGRENFINFYSDWNIKDKEASSSLASNTPKGAHSFDDSASSGAKVQQNPETSKDSERKFFKTLDGHAYGYTYKGKLYIDPRIATAETPVHEYGHLWCEMKRNTAPEEWNQMKQVMLNDEVVQPIIERVRRDYPELAREGKEDDFIEEVITQFSGKRGSERLKEIADEVAAERGGIFGKAEAVTAMQRLKNILNSFWEGVARMMGWKYRNASQIADRIMADMLNGVTMFQKRPASEPFKLSSEHKDAEGNSFYERKGTVDLWSISPLFAKARRQDAPIRLTDRNVSHIMESHGNVFKTEQDVFDFLDGVFVNATKLRRGRGRGMFVVVENDRTDQAAIIKLIPSDTGDYYNVETAGYYRKSKWKDSEEVIADLSEPGQSDAAADASKPQIPDENGGEPINAEAQVSSSGGKDTKNTDTIQENQGENSDEAPKFQKTGTPGSESERPGYQNGEDALHYAERLAEYERQRKMEEEDVAIPSFDDADIALSTYNQTVAKKALKWQEAWQDGMISVKAIQDAIEKETGNKATGAEDAYRYENRMHGRSKNMGEQFEWRFYKPMLKAFSQFMKATGMDIGQAMDYMIAKHGLERNMYYAFRDAMKSKVAEEIKEEREKLEKEYAKGRMSELDYNKELARLKEKESTGVDDAIGELRDTDGYKRLQQDYADGKISYPEYIRGNEELRRNASMRKTPKKDSDGNVVSTNYYDDFAQDFSGLTGTLAKDMYDDAQKIKRAAQRTIDPETRKNLWKAYDKQMRKAYEAARREAESMVLAAERNDEKKPVGDTPAGRLWNAVNAATKRTLQISYESGMMDRKTYNKVRDMFSFYIPLRGWAEDRASDAYTYIGKENVFSPAVKKTWGRTSEAENPLAYIGNIAVSTIIAGHRNMLKQHFLNYVMNNPTSLVSISESWYENIGHEDGEPVWVLRSADTAGKSADEIVQIVNDFNEEMQRKQAEGKAIPVTGRLRLDVNATSGQKAEHVIEVQRAGHTYQLYVNGDPRAAQALNGTIPKSVSRISDTYIGKQVTKLNRSMAAFFTSKNPAFVVSNLSRDLNMAGASVAVNEDPAYNARFIANVARVLAPRLGESSGWMPASRQPTGLMPSLLRKYKKGTLDPSNETERLFKEFMDEGGETGFVNMLSVDSFKEQMLGEIARMNGSSLLGSKGAKETTVGKGLRMLGDTFEFYNRCAEDATRFIVYMTSRQMGKSLEDSIADAKDVTLNFNRKGTGDKGNAEIRDLFIFVNPAIQALANMYRMAKGHPLKLGAVAATFIGGGALMPIINQWLLNMFGDDDDKDTYWNLPPWVRKNNLVMWIPWTKNFLTIPLAQEFRVFYGVGEMISCSVMDHPVHDMGLELVSSVADLVPINPTGNGGNLMVDLSPTAIQPLMQINENVDFTGKPIWRENQGNKYDPMYTKAYVSTPSWMAKLSEKVNSVTGGDEDMRSWLEKHKAGQYLNNPAVWNHLLQGYLGGMYNTIAKGADVIITTAGGEVPKIYQVPVINRFLNRPVERGSSSSLGEDYYELIDGNDEFVRILSKKKARAKDGDVKAREMAERMMQSEDYRRSIVITSYQSLIDATKKMERQSSSEKFKEECRQSVIDLKSDMMEDLAALDGARDPVGLAITKFDGSEDPRRRKAIAVRISREAGASEDPYGDKPQSDHAYQYQLQRTGEDVWEDAVLLAYQEKLRDEGREDEKKTLSGERTKVHYPGGTSDPMLKLRGGDGDKAVMRLIRENRRKLLEKYGLDTRKMPDPPKAGAESGQ